MYLYRKKMSIKVTIKKKLLFFSLLLGVLGIMVSCVAEGESKSTYRSPAVMSYNSMVDGLVMATPYGVVAAPSLQDLNDGDCISAFYTINYDSQPSNEYYTATDIQYQLLPKRIAIEKSGDMIDEYNDSIMNVQLSMSPYFDGIVFIQTIQKGANGQQYKFELICNPDSIDKNGINTVFLKSAKSNENTGGNTTEITTLEAFDLNPLIWTLGKDTVIQDQKFKILPLNLMYQVGERDSAPIYRQFENKAIEIIVFR